MWCDGNQTPKQCGRILREAKCVPNITRHVIKSAANCSPGVIISWDWSGLVITGIGQWISHVACSIRVKYYKRAVESGRIWLVWNPPWQNQNWLLDHEFGFFLNDSESEVLQCSCLFKIGASNPLLPELMSSDQNINSIFVFLYLHFYICIFVFVYLLYCLAATVLWLHLREALYLRLPQLMSSGRSAQPINHQTHSMTAVTHSMGGGTVMQRNAGFLALFFNFFLNMEFHLFFVSICAYFKDRQESYNQRTFLFKRAILLVDHSTTPLLVNKSLWFWARRGRWKNI